MIVYVSIQFALTFSPKCMGKAGGALQLEPWPWPVHDSNDQMVCCLPYAEEGLLLSSSPSVSSTLSLLTQLKRLCPAPTRPNLKRRGGTNRASVSQPLRFTHGTRRKCQLGGGIHHLIGASCNRCPPARQSGSRMGRLRMHTLGLVRGVGEKGR